MQTHPVRAPDGNTGIDDFKHQAGTVLNRPAVRVDAEIGAVLQKFVE